MNLMSTNNEFPKHIAVIMDGNGRWAKERNLKRTAGHEEGAKVVREITTHCASLGIEYLTLYAFSTENWNRPKLEVEFLMKLLERYLKSELTIYMENNICFKVIGDMSKFSNSLQKQIVHTQQSTANNTGLTQVLALNYGSQDEITRAVKKLNEKQLEVTQENIESCLDTAGMPAVDILIRTSGEIRLSNFMLWQCAYAEMFFVQKFWPNFTKYDLDDIVDDFVKRERRFGGV